MTIRVSGARTARNYGATGQRGVGVIEVLIALVVVSLGVLGVAGLQLTGMKHSTGGFNRSKALLYAEDIASRMRLNDTAFARNDGGVLRFDYDKHVSSAGYCAAFAGPVCDERDGTAASLCNAEELAGFDLFTVSCGTGAGAAASSGNSGVNGRDLPGGVLSVNCNDDPCTADSTWSISVDWQEGNAVSDDAAAVDARRVQMTLRP